MLYGEKGKILDLDEGNSKKPINSKICKLKKQIGNATYKQLLEDISKLIDKKDYFCVKDFKSKVELKNYFNMIKNYIPKKEMQEIMLGYIFKYCMIKDKNGKWFREKSKSQKQPTIYTKIKMK